MRRPLREVPVQFVARVHRPVVLWLVLCASLALSSCLDKGMPVKQPADSARGTDGFEVGRSPDVADQNASSVDLVDGQVGDLEVLQDSDLVPDGFLFDAEVLDLGKCGGEWCGNGVCGNQCAESKTTCPEDCCDFSDSCGDGKCKTTGLCIETADNCPQDCF